MPLQTKTFEQIVQEQVAAIQASSPALTDFSEGSVLLALVESNSGAVAIWIQSLLVKLISTTRAATSAGADLDSWMVDYKFFREGALKSKGNVVFSRFTAGQQVNIAVGSQVESSVGSILFEVIADATNPNYNAATNSYIILANALNITIPVSALFAGASGNVAENAIDTIFSPIPFIDTVTNPSNFDNGQDQESDKSFRDRFILYINGLSKATKVAIENAILSFNDKLDFSLTENENYSGDPQPGFFYAVIDDGTGAPSPSLIQQVRDVINLVRGLTITFDVFAVVPVNVTISAQINVADGFDGVQLAIAAQTALNNYVNELKIGNGLPYTRIAQIIYNVSIGIIDVTAIVLNGGTSDLNITNKQGLKPLSIIVTSV